MNTQSNIVPEALDAQRAAPAVLSATRPMYWSLRRELWENRSIYIAPSAVAVVFLIGFMISMVRLRAQMSAGFVFDAAKLHTAIKMPYTIAEGLIMMVVLIVQIFYCLEALHSERRDRSILFWKSLPVSDLTTVVSKASIALALPLLAFVFAVVTQLIMFVLSSAVLLGSGLSVATQWKELSLFPTSVGLLYHLVTVHIFWYAPIYGWLLLVSGWPRRATFLWAVLPPLAVAFVEKIVFNTWYFAAMLRDRFTGPVAYASGAPSGLQMDPMVHLGLGKFLSTPGLWIGLLVFAAFLAGAVRLRRYRGPI